MIFKRLNGESKTIAGAAMLLGLLSFVSRIVGLIRDRILSGEFGASDILDAYYAAFKLPDFVFSLLVIGALSASFIPLFIKALQTKDKETEAWRFTSNVLNIIGVCSLVAVILMVIFARPLSAIIAPGFDGEKREMVIDFTRIMLIAEYLMSISVVFGSVLQGLKRFFFYAIAPILYNFGIIVGAIWLVPLLGINGLAWGVVLGILAHFLIQAFGVFAFGYRYTWILNFKDKAILEMMRLTGPRVLGLAVSQVNIVVTTMLASLLPTGGLTMFNFANNIAYFPIGIIGVSYAVAIFPSLSEYAESKQTEKLISAISSGVRQVLFLVVPCSIVFLLLRAQIVRVVVGAGKFGWEETIITADALALMTIGFFALCLNFLLVRAYFALHDTITPFIVGLFSAVINMAVAWFFLSRYGVLALGGAMSFSAIINFILLWVPLRIRLGTLEEMKILRSLAIITVAGFFAGLTTQAMKPIVVERISLDTFFGVLSQGLVAGGLGLAVYLAITVALKLPEAITFTSVLRRKFLRGYQPKETVPTTTTTAS